MKRFLSISLTFLLLQSSFCFVSLPVSVLARTSNTQPRKTASPLDFVLQDGTPVKLRISRNMSSADAKTGETVDFEVVEDIQSGDIVVISRGSVALGTVTQGKPKGRMGKGGKLDINIDSVRLVSGEKVPLRAVKETKGGGSTGAMTGGIIASSILFFPAAPFFLLMKGKDIKIPKGTEITAYINGDITLNPNKFGASQAGQTMSGGAGQTTAANAAGFATISVKSMPQGADVSVDGKYVGSTPSSLRLPAGEHKISVKKAGYILWERTITLTAGSDITMDAALGK